MNVTIVLNSILSNFIAGLACYALIKITSKIKGLNLFPYLLIGLCPPILTSFYADLMSNTEIVVGLMASTVGLVAGLVIYPVFREKLTKLFYLYFDIVHTIMDRGGYLFSFLAYMTVTSIWVLLSLTYLHRIPVILLMLYLPGVFINSTLFVEIIRKLYSRQETTN